MVESSQARSWVSRSRLTADFDAIREVGPGGHFFGSEHTMSRYEEAFYTPLLSNWSNHESWLEAGAVNTEQRANQIWKQLLLEYQQPDIDPAIDAALCDYVTRRKLAIDAGD